LKPTLSEQELLLKAERFCAYQERCRYDVEKKLYEWGVSKEVAEKIIFSLQENGYLNEERFAKLFTLGKFRIKRWGKNKIKAELKKKHVPESLVKKALNEINQEEYLKTLQYLITRKRHQMKSSDSKIKLQKMIMFLLSRGFEMENIRKVLKYGFYLEFVMSTSKR
jgi:regulatory protein